MPDEAPCCHNHTYIVKSDGTVALVSRAANRQGASVTYTSGNMRQTTFYGNLFLDDLEAVVAILRQNTKELHQEELQQKIQSAHEKAHAD